MTSLLQRLSWSLPEQARLPTALPHPSNAAVQWSDCPGDFCRTSPIALSLHLCTRFGWPGFLQWAVIATSKGRDCDHTEPALRIPSVYKPARAICTERREPLVTKPASAKILPGGPLSFIMLLGV